MRKRLIFLTLAVATLGACGQKGPLTQPDQPEPNQPEQQQQQ
ncbi:lipoprotein [Gallaecimonas sp. GXIMD4217]